MCMMCSPFNFVVQCCIVLFHCILIVVNKLYLYSHVCPIWFGSFNHFSIADEVVALDKDFCAVCDYLGNLLL